ncbi:MAG: Hsp20/alpha crystallin family protein [Nanoarchaeota archaeon]|nr:Hsp20/alpha crystallin family protein [Nanoarchaeota archaeon]MBU1051999.1 Hsp20/alpha crystallin family protein [Nanoarchaeota archaeon]MBU1988714.1 Hsp20/alpha crystallin family protein [Nanoarchaeota archaeon]
MNFFNDDPFDSIVKEFFGNAAARRQNKDDFIQGEEEDRTSDFFEDEKKVYLIFELTGFTEKNVQVVVKNQELEVRAQKKDNTKTQPYLIQKLQGGTLIRKIIPKFANPKKFAYTVKNGVLEIIFDKK